MKKEIKILILFWLLMSVVWYPQEIRAQSRQGEQEEAYVAELYDLTDFGDIEDTLEGETELSFEELVKELIKGESVSEAGRLVTEKIKEQLFGEIEQNKKIMAEIILLAVLFSVLKNFAGAFEAAYVGNLCFIMVYSVLAVLLLQAFLAFEDIVQTALERCIDFMRAFVPTLCISMVFTSDTSSSIGFYQIAFVVIYLVEGLFLYVFLPMIQIYLVLELLVHLLPEERFSNLTELIRDVIGWGMKISVAGIVGLNVVQGFLGPARDRIGQGMIGKAAAAIPGIGNTVGGITELLYGSGMVLKNSIGAAGVCILFLLGLLPVCKVFCLAFFCRVAAAVVQPVSDRRIAGCLKGMADGGMLYVKLLGYGILLFLLTITLSVASTGLAH